MATTIRTRYVGPRGPRGSRIIATGAGRQRTTPYPHHLAQGARAHAYAAVLLAERLGITGPLTTDATYDPALYVHTIGEA